MTAMTSRAGSQQAQQASEYGIYITNSSTQNNLQAIVYQDDPQGVPENAVALSWMTKECHVNTKIDFLWTLQYNFIWGQNGSLAPGTSYDAGETIDADLVDSNHVTLSYPGGGFEFSEPDSKTPAGSLYITEAADVPDAGGCVGIGMQGAGTFVVPTHSTGKGNVALTPHPTYYIAFGSYKAGIIVDESELYYPYKLTFPAGKPYAVCDYVGTDPTGWNVTYSSTKP
jgi:hypothetical protein